MDTYEFVERWNVRVPLSWEMQANWMLTRDLEDFVSVTGEDILFLPGNRVRGIPEADAERMVAQGLIKKIGE